MARKITYPMRLAEIVYEASRTLRMAHGDDVKIITGGIAPGDVGNLKAFIPGRRFIVHDTTRDDAQHFKLILLGAVPDGTLAFLGDNYAVPKNDERPPARFRADSISRLKAPRSDGLEGAAMEMQIGFERACLNGVLTHGARAA